MVVVELVVGGIAILGESLQDTLFQQVLDLLVTGNAARDVGDEIEADGVHFKIDDAPDLVVNGFRVLIIRELENDL